MLHLSSHERYYFYNQVVDMRKGCYGLCGIVQNELKKNVLNGDVFVFINKRHNQIKLLQWDRDGFALLKGDCRKVRLSNPFFKRIKYFADQSAVATYFTRGYFTVGEA